jgi:hypothetical protein
MLKVLLQASILCIFTSGSMKLLQTSQSHKFNFNSNSNQEPINESSYFILSTYVWATFDRIVKTNVLVYKSASPMVNFDPRNRKGMGGRLTRM